ncbi:MAG: WbqC family protein [Candidatus Delongbacteria bacterium]
MEKKKIAILQSNYIPWKGYFDIIDRVDEFILYDTAQYTKRDWRNRNLIKSDRGKIWLTIPVQVKNKFDQSINDVEVADHIWCKKHFRSIVQNYSKAECFRSYSDFFEDLYSKSGEFEYLSQINEFFLKKICGLLGIDTHISRSGDYAVYGTKSEALISLCEQTGADVYLSGPSAKDYLNVDLFSAKKISVEWMNYEGYRKYDQLYGDFEHSVSVIDLILNTGDKAIEYIRKREA